MQNNVFLLIDQLVSMSGSTSSYENLDSELTIIESEIPKIKAEIKELEASMTEDKYFDASQEIVDRNIELSVSKKLDKLEKELDKLKEEQITLQTEERQSIEKVDLLKQKIVKAKRNISIISARIERTSEESTKEIYNKIFEQEREKIESLQLKLENENKSLTSISQKVDDINQKVSRVTKEIELCTSRLYEVKKSLNSKKNYIDENLKNKDSETIKNLQTKLLDLEAKKLTILTDAIYISSEIKELFIAEKENLAMKKLAELVAIVNEKPYMEINDIDSLQQELSKLENTQNNLINIIDNKEYYGNDVLYLDNRINHLKKLINVKKDEIKATKSRISQIDNELVIDITEELKNAENTSEKIEQAIKDYEKLINSKDQKNNSTLVALQATYNKKNNELKVIRNIIERYTRELAILIETSSGLEEEKLTKLNEEIDSYNNEIEELVKIKLLSTKFKDVIEQENDKLKLKEVTESINSLRQRLSFGKTPQEIYDEIEMFNASNDSKLNYNEFIEGIQRDDNKSSISDLELTLDNEPEINKTITDDELTNEELNEKDEITGNFEINDEPEISSIEKDPDEFELTDMIETIKELETSGETKEEEAEYSFSELEDTDYFSLDDFLKNLEEE